MLDLLLDADLPCGADAVVPLRKITSNVSQSSFSVALFTYVPFKQMYSCVYALILTWYAIYTSFQQLRNHTFLWHYLDSDT